jgi:hypothetical protein
MGVHVDQASLVNFVFGYLVTMAAIFMAFLPAIITVVVLLLLAGVLRLLGLLVTVAALRPLKRLGRHIRTSLHEFRARPHGPFRLLPH